MPDLLYSRTVLIDSSAVIALLGEREQFHQDASRFFSNASRKLSWCALRVTSHEAFTTARYATTHLRMALDHYDFFRSYDIALLDFTTADEALARGKLERYHDKELSFHDALCAAVMERERLYRIFSFDSDFWTFGFEILPGIT